MLKFVLVCGFFVVASAGGYGGGSSGGSSGGYGGGSGGGSGGGGGGLVSGFGGGPVTAAVQSTHTVEIRHVNVPQELPQPQIVEVEAGNLPLTIHFKSASSALNVVQTHQPGVAGEAQHTSSEDEPHRLVHEVTKPVIQEVREIITPFRRVIQEIKPVQEEIQTIIAKGEPRGNLGGDGGAGLALGGGGGGGGGLSLGGGGSIGGGYGGSSGGLKSSGGYAASASNPPSAVASPRASSKASHSSSHGSPSGVSYFNDNTQSGISFAASQAPSSSSSSSKPSSQAAYSGSNQIRILEGGNSRSSGLSGLSAYKSRA